MLSPRYILNKAKNRGYWMPENAHRWYVSSLRTFHGRLWGNIKISSVSMFDGDTESMPFIGEGNSTTLAWPVTFDPASDTTLGTDIRTHGTDSVST